MYKYSLPLKKHVTTKFVAKWIDSEYIALNRITESQKGKKPLPHVWTLDNTCVYVNKCTYGYRITCRIGRKGAKY